MGTKISEFTETGIAPTGAYIPVAYESENYKVSIKTLNEGGLGGGGYIDSATVLTKGSNTATFSDFNKDTQIIVAQPVSSAASGYPEYSIETVELVPDSSVTATITQGSTTSFTVTLALSSAGVVTASHSQSTSGKINLMRFAKASATENSVGRAYGRFTGGSTTSLATMQTGAFNMTGTHQYVSGSHNTPGTNTFTFTFGSTITNPVPIVTPHLVPSNSQVSVNCTTTECTVTITSSNKMSGCACLIL